MSDTNDPKALYDSFKARFPLDSLATMPLDVYTNTRQDSFCYWLEAETERLGSIWGGSAYKFGIYKCAKPTSDVAGRKTDGQYAWYAKFGSTRDEAFAAVRSAVERIARCAAAGDFAAIESIDFGSSVKWKIAFMYADLRLVGIFKHMNLAAGAEYMGVPNAERMSVAELQQAVIKVKPHDMDVFGYGKLLWDEGGRIIASRRKIWLYAPGERASNWESNLDLSIMSIGWDEIGDMRQYKVKADFEKAIQSAYSTNKSQSSNSKTCYDFVYTMQEGDIVIAKRGLYDILGIGVVNSAYRYDESQDEFCNIRDVEWTETGCWTIDPSQDWRQLPQKTLTLKDKTFYDKIRQLINTRLKEMNESNQYVKLLKEKKQVVLQGAPGTGKTYTTAELAVRLCNPLFSCFDNRDKLMDEYRRLVADGRIAFTTFHQSLDYEEFVEGLRPVDGDGGMRFEPQAGIFLSMAVDAFFAAVKPGNKKLADSISFDEVKNDLIEEISNGTLKGFTTRTGIQSAVPVISTQKNIRIKSEGGRTYTISFSRLSQLYKKFPTVAAVEGMGNIETSVRGVIGGCNVPLYWAVLREMVTRIERYEQEASAIGEDTVAGYDIGEMDYRRKLELIETMTQNRDADLDFSNADASVLVIDEINRGNISKILGELITLLEADKRSGEPNALMVTLPYSRMKFGVPPNLYIIATMNTADRSIGTLDYAIRRRFGFIPMKSERKVVEAFYGDAALRDAALALFDDVEDLMKHINASFNKSEMMIGHSYFLAKSFDELGMKLDYEIKPLLREYCTDGILMLAKGSDGEYAGIEALSLKRNG